MEFFTIAEATTDERTLQEKLTVRSLPHFCAFIHSVAPGAGEEGRILSLWGEFGVRRELIKGGVRFTLPGCPNALAWTVTSGYPPAPEKVVVHLTINRTEHDPDFIESLESFLFDWRTGIEERIHLPVFVHNHEAEPRLPVLG